MALVLPSTQGKSINLTEVWLMDDTGCRGFFRTGCDLSPPVQSINASSSKGVACTISPSSLAIREPRCARWSAGFVPKCKLARSPLWATDPGAPPAPASRPRTSRPGDDSHRRCSRVEPCSGTSPAHARGGYFSSCPCWPARVRFDQLVRQASYPGSPMVPATSALLSLLVLKLLDKERRSHINDFNFDEAVGLFAGLNVPPKKSAPPTTPIAPYATISKSYSRAGSAP